MGMQGGQALNGDKIEAAYVGYSTLFNDRVQKLVGPYQRLAQIIEDDREVNTLVWLNDPPAMRKWVGNKRLYKLSGESQTIKCDPYETSVQVPKRDVINDRLGLHRGKIGKLATRYGQALDSIVISAFVGGISAGDSCYDGQYLIDSDHKFSSQSTSTQSNLVGGALSVTTFESAIERMSLFVDDDGAPLDVMPRYLVVGPKNRTTGKKLVQQRALATGEDNIHAGELDLIVHPRITGTQWALFTEDPQAILLQLKRGPEFLSVEEGDHAFDTGNYKYGIEAEMGAKPGLWFHVCGGPGA